MTVSPSTFWGRIRIPIPKNPQKALLMVIAQVPQKAFLVAELPQKTLLMAQLPQRPSRIRAGLKRLFRTKPNLHHFPRIKPKLQQLPWVRPVLSKEPLTTASVFNGGESFLKSAERTVLFLLPPTAVKTCLSLSAIYYDKTA